MFGPKITSVFTSRWKALWWAAGMLLTAYCSIPSPDPPPVANPAQAAATQQHLNPWSKNYKPPQEVKPDDPIADLQDVIREANAQPAPPPENPWAKPTPAK